MMSRRVPENAYELRKSGQHATHHRRGALPLSRKIGVCVETTQRCGVVAELGSY